MHADRKDSLLATIPQFGVAMWDRIANRDDYDRLRQTFRWEQPEFFNFGRDVVDRRAASTPDRVALWWAESDSHRQVTWAEISARSSSISQGLADLGLQSGDRVLVLLPRMIAWWETLLALLKRGLVAMPGTALLTPRDLEYRLKVSEATAVITDTEGAEKVDAVRERLPTLRNRILVSNDRREGWHAYDELSAARPAGQNEPLTRATDPALIYFTSGTTGMPKMVLHTQASYGLGHAVTGRWWLDLGEDDLHWNVSDTGWAKAAWSSFFGPWLCGAAIFVHHGSAKFNPADIPQYLAEFPITSLCAAPTIYRYLIQLDFTGFHSPSLRQCVAAGEPLNPEVIAAWRRSIGLTIRDGYGQTETVVLCANFPGIEVRAGSMGLPAPGIDLAVIDEAGQRLAPGQTGALAVSVEPNRPLGLFQEYWRNPEANAASFRDGWYITGDCAHQDEDGYFWFVGRADDVITSSAYRIGPFEVESALIEHPAVVEAAVVGKPDPMRGEIVKAYVVLASDCQGSDVLKSELQEHVKRVTAPYKYPREIDFVDQLPKTLSGKIRRVELRQRAARE
jgi:acetyl-CoA synthetase/medium-chain acyl-CoA synthetase